MKTKLLFLSLFLGLAIIASSCSDTLTHTEDELPEFAQTSQKQGGAVNEEVEANAVSGCMVYGPNQYFGFWEADIDSVLSTCHIENLSDMGNDCVYWRNITSEVTLDYQFAGLVTFSASSINNWIQAFANAADANRPSGGNWMIKSITFTRHGTCSWGYTCYKMKVTYRKYICRQIIILDR